MKSIQRSASRNKLGSLFTVNLQSAELCWSEGGPGWRPRGLWLASSGGAVRLHLEVGDPDGGAQMSRTISVTRSGAWLSAAGWAFVKAEVQQLAEGASVLFCWTTEAPPSNVPLLFVETIAAGTSAVPDGAYTLHCSEADASWQWSTDTGGGAILVDAPQAGGAAAAPVLGDQYVATVANTITWFLRSP